MTLGLGLGPRRDADAIERVKSDIHDLLSQIDPNSTIEGDEPLSNAWDKLWDAVQRLLVAQGSLPLARNPGAPTSQHVKTVRIRTSNGKWRCFSCEPNCEPCRAKWNRATGVPEKRQTGAGLAQSVKTMETNLWDSARIQSLKRILEELSKLIGCDKKESILVADATVIEDL